MPTELLAVAGVDKSDRVVCRAPGCGQVVFRRTHIVGQDGMVAAYGSECFEKLFKPSAEKSEPWYGSAEDRELKRPSDRFTDSAPDDPCLGR